MGRVPDVIGLRLLTSRTRSASISGLLCSAHARLTAASSIKTTSPPLRRQIDQRRYLRLDPSPKTPARSTNMSMMSSPPYNQLSFYTFGTPNGLKPALLLEELGLKYESHPVNIMKNEQKEPWYLDINPNGRIPALKDGDLRVFESGAIMLYVADHYDKENKFTYEHGTDLYYEMLSWVMWQMGGLGPMQGQANHFRLMAPVYDTYGMKRYIEETKRLISVLEIRLSKADWLAGDKYTIADMASWPWVKGAGAIEIDLKEFPGVERWIKRIAERPATDKAKTAAGVRPDEQMKEMLDGMRAKMDAKKETHKDEL